MSSTKASGIIFANMHDSAGGGLTKSRSMASLPFGGRYRLIDFPLSIMTACGIQEAVVVTKSNYRSLMDHVGNGRPWDLSRKNQGLIMAPPFAEEGGVYHGKVEALYNALSYIQRSKAPYVVLADCNWVYNPDLRAVVAQHEQTGADITMVCSEQEVNSECARYCVCAEHTNGAVTNLQISPRIDSTQKLLVSTNTFVMSRELLTRLVNDAMSSNRFNFERDVLLQNKDKLHIRAFIHEGYAAMIYSPLSYYKANMDLLNASVTSQLFLADKPICTKVRDEAPVRYGLNSHVSNCAIADGCIIEGTVENSLLFRGVKIGRGAIVRNSIIMQGSVVEDKAQLNYIVADKNVLVRQEIMLTGVRSYPLYIEKGKVLE